jgi:predicted MPP superfamily phosphohydrolase
MNVIKGLQMQDGKPFYISEGLGQTGLNIRVGSRPEVTIHELTLSITKRKAVKAG